MALAHPARRAIVQRLLQGPTTVGDASRGLGLSKPAITKHIKLLEDAGLLSRTVTGREHRLTFNATGIDDAFRWLDAARGHWARHMDAVEAHLQQPDNEGSQP